MKIYKKYELLKFNLIIFLIILFYGLLTIEKSLATEESPFDFPEIQVTKSPETPKYFRLNHGDVVLDIKTAPDRPEAAVLVTSENRQRLIFWSIAANSDRPVREIEIPKSIQLFSLAWHPHGQSIFLIGKENAKYIIYRNELNKWEPEILYRSTNQIKNIVIGPQPFLVPTEGQSDQTQQYRVFFGLARSDKTFATRSITETGARDYAVLDTKQSALIAPDDAVEPATIITGFGLPEMFHPAGHLFIWKDAKDCFKKATYDRDNWKESIENIIGSEPLCGGVIAYTPNGIALTRWEPKREGIELISNHGKKKERIAADIAFTTPPSITPDGRGLVGVMDDHGIQVLNYLTITIPLADVMNAWMFTQSPKDTELFTQHSGLFRTTDYDQLYKLYDSELYICNGYDSSTPTRPYYVTTDIFWELYSASFEGIFLLSERQSAIPHFWQFVENAQSELAKDQAGSKMSGLMTALRDIHRHTIAQGSDGSDIASAKGIKRSSFMAQDFNYDNLKPRSHYAADAEMIEYFRASKFFMSVKLDEADRATLKSLSDQTKSQALAWIKVYSNFIAPSRNEILWDNRTKRPDYITAPANEQAQVFPLSFGVDNEIFYNTVYDRIPDRRLLPSGLFIPAVLGSDMANILLEDSGEYKTSPSLKQRIADLRRRLGNSKAWLTQEDGLYQKWLGGLATQWSSDIASPENVIQKEFWQRKRLQTGLASWATLRHSTVLVNERVAAECGESGFEFIVLTPPRGYVEPDPKTFDAIAYLFDATISVVKQLGGQWNGKDPTDESDQTNKALQNAIIRRLSESRDHVMNFKNIAAKEVANQPLTSQEYEAILYVGRAAEHNFLIFKSLANKDFALSTPDPVNKIADVAFNGDSSNPSYLMAGVGGPIELDQIVPFFGRRAVVKGSAYSYYELISPKVLDDKEWINLTPSTARPPWISPDFSAETLACPPQNP